MIKCTKLDFQGKWSLWQVCIEDLHMLARETLSSVCTLKSFLILHTCLRLPSFPPSSLLSLLPPFLLLFLHLSFILSFLPSSFSIFSLSIIFSSTFFKSMVFYCDLPSWRYSTSILLQTKKNLQKWPMAYKRSCREAIKWGIEVLRECFCFCWWWCCFAFQGHMCCILKFPR